MNPECNNIHVINFYFSVAFANAFEVTPGTPFFCMKSTLIHCFNINKCVIICQIKEDCFGSGLLFMII